MLALVTLTGCVAGQQVELPTLPPNPIPTFLPTLLSIIPSATPVQPTLTPTPRGTVNPETAPVTDESMFEFVSETVPDGTRFEPGQAFSKTWRYRNEGPLKWTKGYGFLRISTSPAGSTMDSPELVDISKEVSPGEEVDFTVAFVAPSADGIYSVVYQIMNERGELLAGTESWVTIIVGDVAFPVTSSKDQVRATLVKGSFELGFAVVDFCMDLPDGRAWYPWDVTITLDGKAISPEGSVIDPTGATTAHKCFRYTFPVLELLSSGKDFTLSIGKVELPPEVNQAENCALAQSKLRAEYPGLDFECAGPGSFYTGLVLPAGMTAEKADTLIMDAMSNTIYGPWVLTGTFE